jgi:hypothetical protein
VDSSFFDDSIPFFTLKVEISSLLFDGKLLSPKISFFGVSVFAGVSRGLVDVEVGFAVVACESDVIVDVAIVVCDGDAVEEAPVVNFINILEQLLRKYFCAQKLQSQTVTS